jgi:lysophospholipase L1-like esterase
VSGSLRIAWSLLVLGSALPAAAQQRWILAGDSIQTGVFANAEYGLVGGDARDLTASIVTQETGVTVLNFSSPGARMTTLPPGYFPGLKDQKPGISYLDGFFGVQGIVITIGVNDSGLDTDPGTYQTDYAGFVTHARNRGLEVVCVLPLNEPNEVPDINVSRRFNIQLRTYFACTGAGVPAANVFNPAAVGIYPDDANPAKERLFAPDHVHLTSDGHALFAEKLIDFMVARGYWTRN